MHLFDKLIFAMERVFFNRDILTGCLLPLLSLYDVATLFFTSIQFKATYKRTFHLTAEESATLHMFNMRIFKGLSFFYGEKDAQIMMEHIKCGNLILTGGFLLAIINGENVRVCEDVDVISIVYNYNRKNYSELTDKRTMDIMNSFSSKIKLAPYEPNSYTNLNFVVETLEFVLQQSKLQLLFMPDAHSPDLALQAHIQKFDYDFCKNMFSKNRLVVMKLLNVLDKSCRVSLVKCYSIFMNVAAFDINLHLDKVWKRINKYRSRGYFLELHDKYILTATEGPRNDVWNLNVADWNEFWEKHD